MARAHASFTLISFKSVAIFVSRSLFLGYLFKYTISNVTSQGPFYYPTISSPCCEILVPQNFILLGSELYMPAAQHSVSGVGLSNAYQL